MKNIVLSGININEGGALTVYKEIISELIKLNYNKNNKITAFIHNKQLFSEFDSEIEFIELPKSKKNWLNRLYYEYIFFNKYSKKNKVNIWISMHDITPRVKAQKRYVYCHNPSPFYKAKIKEGYKIYLFSKLYKYLYKINIKQNTAVIVQQNWMRQAFKEMYNIDKIIVARPNIDTQYKQYKYIENSKFTFIYPAFPRTFKNFEIICEAVKKINSKENLNFEVKLTIDGSENQYSYKMVEQYKDIINIKFIGLQDKKDVYELYEKSNCMIFPSKLETWGLPISEYKETNKAILLADLPYAHETLGKYEKAIFFNPYDSSELCEIMIKEIKNKNIYSETEENEIEDIYARNWEKLLEIILK